MLHLTTTWECLCCDTHVQLVLLLHCYKGDMLSCQTQLNGFALWLLIKSWRQKWNMSAWICVFLETETQFVCDGDGGVNYISVIIGGQLVPFRQESLSSVTIASWWAGNSLALSTVSNKMGPRCCYQQRQRQQLQSISPVTTAFPESFLSPILIELQPVSRGANRNHKKSISPREWMRSGERRLDGNRAALRGSLPSRILRCCLPSLSD